MHLTAKRAATGLHPAPFPTRTRVPDGGHRRDRTSIRASARRSLIRLNSAFRALSANFLVLSATDSHYSVINRYPTSLLALGYVGCRPFNATVLASQLEVSAFGAGRGRCRLVPGTGDFHLVHVHTSGEWRFNPNWPGCAFEPAEERIMRMAATTLNESNSHVPTGHCRMSWANENIPATNPLCATVAPILHIQAYTKAHRGTNLNNGAAA
jgi:hypothetical protein